MNAKLKNYIDFIQSDELLFQFDIKYHGFVFNKFIVNFLTLIYLSEIFLTNISPFPLSPIEQLHWLKEQ